MKLQIIASKEIEFLDIINIDTEPAVEKTNIPKQCDNSILVISTNSHADSQVSIHQRSIGKTLSHTEEVLG